MLNVGNAGGDFWAPNINIVKDPRWGRLQETPGECPVLTSTYAAEFVSHFQATGKARRVGDDDTYLRASSCCKHFAAYSEENWDGLDRYHFDAVVSPREWRDTYEPAFQACVVEANASGLMCSYNALNGKPTCADPELLRTLARDTFGFTGYVTGDCGAAEDVFATHHFAATPAGAAAASLAAGMDIDCGSFVKANLPAALANASVPFTERQLDENVGHLFAVRLRLGLFDGDAFDPCGFKALRPADVNASAHNALALRAAVEGIVLLENKAGALPLARLATWAVVGPLADNGPTMQGVDCHGVPPFLITPREGIAALRTSTGDLVQTHYAPGCAISGSNTSGLDAAVTAVAASDVAVVLVGLDRTQEYEMRDRTSLLLPRIQRRLVEAACASAAQGGKRCVVGLISGGVIDVSEMASNPNVSALLWLGYPGHAGLVMPQRGGRPSPSCWWATPRRAAAPH